MSARGGGRKQGEGSGRVATGSGSGRIEKETPSEWKGEGGDRSVASAMCPLPRSYTIEPGVVVAA